MHTYVVLAFIYVYEGVCESKNIYFSEILVYFTNCRMYYIGIATQCAYRIYEHG